MAFEAYTYLFVFTLIAAFIDAYGIGANDVANSFATSVSSRSLTFRQAMLAAGVCEFAGAVLVGARVTSTIKGGVINLDLFGDNAASVLLAFTCVSVGSASWLTFATRHAMPVSTTHTVIGSLIGVGVAAGGARGVQWGWDGVSQIFASWGIAPAISGALAAIVFTFTKYAVLKRKNAVKIGLILLPVYFFIVASVLCTVIIAKGAPSLNLDELPPGTTAGAILGTGAVVSLLSTLFFLPYVHSQVVKKDYTVRWYHFFIGPLLWRRPAPADAGSIGAKRAVPDYYEGHHNDREIAEGPASTDDVEDKSQNDRVDADGSTHKESDDVIAEEKLQLGASKDEAVPQTVPPRNESKLARLERILAGADVNQNTMENGRPAPPPYRKINGSPIEPWNMWIIVRYNALPWIIYTLTAGLRTDIHKMQRTGHDSEEARRLAQMHARAAHYDNDVEGLFSFMQILTACTASFAHGANDVSNAIGPLVVVYQTWQSMQVPGKSESVPIWILVLGAAGIVIGLGTYGWKLMSILGNRLTLHSPSRGFSMEFGASITVVLASYLSLPVSTTQSITGATVGVALCNGDAKSLNWKMLCWIFFSWVLTLPFAGLISGCLYAIIANAPRGI